MSMVKINNPFKAKNSTFADFNNESNVESFIESTHIMANKYLFDKIQKGRREAKQGKIKVHDLKDFADEN